MLVHLTAVRADETPGPQPMAAAGAPLPAPADPPPITPQGVAQMRRELAERRVSRNTLGSLLGGTAEMSTTLAARLSTLQTVLLSEVFHLPADSIAAMRWGRYPAAPGRPLAGSVFLTLWPTEAGPGSCRVITIDTLGFVRSR